MRITVITKWWLVIISYIKRLPTDFRNMFCSQHAIFSQLLEDFLRFVFWDKRKMRYINPKTKIGKPLIITWTFIVRYEQNIFWKLLIRSRNKTKTKHVRTLKFNCLYLSYCVFIIVLVPSESLFLCLWIGTPLAMVIIMESNSWIWVSVRNEIS